MTSADPRVIYAGTVDYIDIPITSDVDLTSQTVEFSFDDRATWHAATWTGEPGKTRTASLLLDESNTPSPRDLPIEVLVRIDYGQTKPIELAGRLFIR